jgi:hypothetical protein
VREAEQARLGCGVVRPHDRAGERRDGRHEQNAAKAPFTHPGQRALCEQERRAEVDREHLVEIVAGYLFEPLSAAEPGVGDEHVDRSQGGLDCVDELGGCLGRAQVGADRDRAAAARDDLGRKLLGCFGTGAIAEGDGRPFGCKPGCEGLSDPAACAGEKRHPTVEGVAGCHDDLPSPP